VYKYGSSGGALSLFRVVCSSYAALKLPHFAPFETLLPTFQSTRRQFTEDDLHQQHFRNSRLCSRKFISNWILREEKGRRMIQALRPRPLTVDFRDQYQARTCGICDGQNYTGTGFSPSTSVSPCQQYFTKALYSFVYHRRWSKRLTLLWNKTFIPRLKQGRGDAVGCT
jgi:hypothetical protein